MQRTTAMKIQELRPKLKRVSIRVKVVDIPEPHPVVSKRDNTRHMVSDIVVGDETGLVTMTVWDDEIEEFKVGGVFDLEDAYTSVFKATLRLNLGRYGMVKEVEGEGIEVNMDVDHSAQIHERYDRGRRRMEHSFSNDGFWP